MPKYFLTSLMVLFVVFCLESQSFSTPLIGKIEGGFAENRIITVEGSGFGEVAKPDYYQYFDDYSSDWFCNGPKEPDCSQFPTAGSGTQITMHHGMGKVMECYGKPLLNLSKDYSQYSTGRGYWQALERYDLHLCDGSTGRGRMGAEPGAGIAMKLRPSTELFFVLYVWYDPLWKYDLPGSKPGIEKVIQINGKLFDHRVDNFHLGKLVYIWHRNPVTLSFGANEIGGEGLFTKGLFPGAGKWMEIKSYLKLNTQNDPPNGIARIWLDGKLVGEKTGFKFYQVDADPSRNWLFGSSPRGDDFPNSGNIQYGAAGQFLMPDSGKELVRAYDDFLVNLSDKDPSGGVFPAVACIYLSNSAEWGKGPEDRLNGDHHFVRQVVGGSNFEDQGFKSWRDNEFKFKVTRGHLNFEKPVYLYVTNWRGQTNTQGFRMMKP